MADQSKRRRRLPAVGVSAVGLAVSAGTLGLTRDATAEPVPTPLVSPPAEVPAWSAVPTPLPVMPPPKPLDLPRSDVPKHDGGHDDAMQDPGVMQTGGVAPVVPTAAAAALAAPAPPVLPAGPAVPPPGLPTLPAPVIAPATLPAPAEVKLPAPDAAKPPAAAPAPNLPPPGEWPILPDRAGPAGPAVPAPAPVALPTPVPVWPAPAVVPTPRPPVEAVPVSLPKPPSSAPAQPEKSARLMPPSGSPGPVSSLPSPGSPSNLGVTPGAAAPGAPPGGDAVVPKLAGVKSALVGAALAAGPARADDAKPTPAAPAPAVAMTPEQQRDLVATVEALKTRLKAAEDKAEAQAKEIVALKEVADGRKDATGITVTQGLKAQFDDLLRKFTELTTKYDALAKRVGDPTSTSASPATPTAPPQQMPGGPPIVTGPKGTVRIINEYAVAVKLILNGYKYDVAPNQVVDVPVPAGTYTYELLGAGPSETKPIKDGETFNLKIK